MISIPRYVSSHGRYYRINDPAAETSPERRVPSSGAPVSELERKGRPPAPRRGGPMNITNLFSSVGLDSGDLLLLLVLFFLYKESKDEDFLIILIVLALSMFK